MRHCACFLSPLLETLWERLHHNGCHFLEGRLPSLCLRSLPGTAPSAAKPAAWLSLQCRVCTICCLRPLPGVACMYEAIAGSWHYTHLPPRLPLRVSAVHSLCHHVVQTSDTPACVLHVSMSEGQEVVCNFDLLLRSVCIMWCVLCRRVCCAC